MQTTDRNRTNLYRLTDRLNRGDLTIVDELVAPAYVLHSASGGEIGIEGYRKYLAAVRAIYPDFEIRIEQLVAEGDLLAQRFTWRGTYHREFQPVDEKGIRVTVQAMAISRFEDGRIAEEWTLHDRLGLYQQLGIVPPDTELGR